MTSDPEGGPRPGGQGGVAVRWNSHADPRTVVVRDILHAVISKLVASLPAIGDDIKKPGVTEGAYDRTPLKAAQSLRRLQKVVREDLARVTQPETWQPRATRAILPTRPDYFTSRLSTNKPKPIRTAIATHPMTRLELKPARSDSLENGV